jgi:hypothetical protein
MAQLAEEFEDQRDTSSRSTSKAPARSAKPLLLKTLNSLSAMSLMTV